MCDNVCGCGVGDGMTTLKEVLAKKLTKQELAIVKTSFDMLGSLAIIEIPRELVKKEKLIGEALLRLHKQITTVLKKVGGHTGRFRKQKLRVIAGKRTKSTLYKESGAVLRVHAENAYFSPRYGTERLRIAKQVCDDEDVLVLFSGIAPFPLVMVRNARPKHVVAVEMNPLAHKIALENIKLNKCDSKIVAYLGDVRKVVPKLKQVFDRVLMPLPKTGEDFLDVAIKATKRDGILHFYDFLTEEEFYRAGEKVRSVCEKLGRKCAVLRIVKCGRQSPHMYRVCADVKIE